MIVICEVPSQLPDARHVPVVIDELVSEDDATGFHDVGALADRCVRCPRGP